MISIIIPVYNVEQYLSECLDSILSQTYADFEVILVDDGSIDNSGMICDEYAHKDSRMRVIHQRNAGVSAARNKGIENSKGEWVTFVDSDDWLDTDFLTSFQLSDGIDISFTGLCYMRCPERVEIKLWQFEEKTISLSKDFDDIANNNLLEYGTVCCKAYKRQVLNANNLRFNTSLSYHEDHLFLLQYLQYIDKVSLHKAIGYNYRITNLGLSLSSKVHPWEKLNSSSEAMFYELTHIPFLKYLPQWYIIKISTFCLSPKVSACHSVYMSNISKDDKKVAFKVITKDSQILKDYYQPIGIKNKIQKACILRGYAAINAFYLTINFAKKLLRR